MNYQGKCPETMKTKPLFVPRNFFVKSSSTNQKDIFKNTIKEDRAIEQYFWTSSVVHKLLKATEYQFSECCCFTTPSLAQAYHESGNNQALLDIDTRFKYLPRFERFDIKNPHVPTGADTFEIIVIDPPFFGICTQDLLDATNLITGKNYDTKIIIAYLVRHELTLLKTFENYGISETSTPLEYAHIKPNKWRNFALYSNVDLPGVKRIPDKYNYKGKDLKQK